MNLIIDCYTDEPSGLGAPPYLSVHSRYLAGVLKNKGRSYQYITIDDLRYINGEKERNDDSLNKRVINRVADEKAQNYLDKSKNLYIIMGSFVNYNYLSCEPPSFKELNELLGKYRDKDITLMYALGSIIISKDEIEKILPPGLFKTVVLGNFYNYILTGDTDDFQPHYDKLRDIAVDSADILSKLKRPLIMEIESATGCDRKPGCKFCIESLRGYPNTSRDVEDIVAEMKALYDGKARYFRIGRQPNFYSYQNTNPKAIEELFRAIRSECPDLKTLHIDNVSPHSVNTLEGMQISELVAIYCTSGNIAPLGVESFDLKIRELNNLNGSVEDILNSIKIINRVGSQQDTEGTRKFLPGLNFIYGLEGQSKKTIQENLKCLENILQNGYIRRIFVRNLTSPHGMVFGEQEALGFDDFRGQIIEKFSMPMLKKVYPQGTILKSVRVEMQESGDAILRQMGTCAERVLIKNKELLLDDFYTVRVKDYINDRTMEGEIVCKE